MSATTQQSKGGILLDLVGTGDGALAIGVRDRRTFKSWAKRAKVKPAARWNGDDLYLRKDIQKVVEFKNAEEKKKA